MRTIGFKNHSINPPSGKTILKYGIFYGLWGYLCIPILLRAIYSNDVYKALYSGRYLSWFGQFPHHTTFTLNRTLEILPRDTFNWLGNLLLYQSHSLLGSPGLIIFRGLLLILVLAMIHSILNWNLNPVTLIFLAILPYAAGQKLLLRTALFAVPMTVVLYWIWYQFRHQNKRRWLWAFPMALLLWSQLHGSYQMGIGLTLVLLGGDAIQRLLKEKSDKAFLLRYGLVVLLVFGAVTFVSPFPDYSLLERGAGVFNPAENQNERNITGIREGAPGNPDEVPLLQEALRDYFGGNFQTVYDQESSQESIRDQIKFFLQSLLFKPQNFRSGEYDFPLEHTDRLFVQASLFLLVLGLLSFLVPGSRCQLPLLLTVLTAGIFGLAHARTVAYIPLSVGPILAIKTQQGDFGYLTEWVFNTYSYLIGILLISAFSGILGGLLLTNNLQLLSGIPGHQLGTHTRYSASTSFVRKIRDQFYQQKFFNNYDPGAFLVWEWWPYKKVFVDSKWTAYDPDFRRHFVHTPLPKLLRKQNINYAITTDRSHWPLYFDRSEEWSLMDENGQFFVFERVNTTQASDRDPQDPS